ncbi:MAG: decarboxylating 6-phosphogluconate dehydrogenase [Deltaproteobacteria bacterium]|nr:decarboxylating 6-phosphogluconate dehydrogenase [Deltaproteobacteria bacterium]
MRLGMIGLGRMGMNMCRRVILGGHTVAAFDMDQGKRNEAADAGIQFADSVAALVAMLPCPRAVWIMLPAGGPVDEAIKTLRPLLAPGDYIIDGGNSFYKDDLRRAEELKGTGINYVDAGVSGGIWGLKNGYALMAGCTPEQFKHMEPVFKSLAPPDGYMRCGPVGAGHFVKMVHNGIEYGMMEAYAEGFELLKASRYGAEADLAGVAALWNNGSVIRSWLLELVEDALKKDKDLASIRGFVEDSGEGRWTVAEAIETGVFLPVITESLMRRLRSRQTDPFAEKVLAAMRAGFGGHAVKKRE